MNGNKEIFQEFVPKNTGVNTNLGIAKAFYSDEKIFLRAQNSVLQLNLGRTYAAYFIPVLFYFDSALLY